jgi:hypothetical protein
VRTRPKIRKGLECRRSEPGDLARAEPAKHGGGDVLGRYFAGRADRLAGSQRKLGVVGEAQALSFRNAGEAVADGSPQDASENVIERRFHRRWCRPIKAGWRSVARAWLEEMSELPGQDSNLEKQDQNLL